MFSNDDGLAGPGGKVTVLVFSRSGRYLAVAGGDVGSAGTLLLYPVDDIDIPNFDPHTQYFSQPGWEQRFGYGRPNIGRAVREIEAGRIPPEVDVDRPYWFEVVYPDTPAAQAGLKKD